MRPLTKALLLIGGTVCVGLGVLGMFLPLLPTTPFLLAAAFFFARSSPRCHHWLMTNRWCGRYIRNYREGRGISRGHKVISILLLWLTIAYAGVFVVSCFAVRLMLLGIAMGVTMHVVSIPTCTAQPPAPESFPRASACNDRQEIAKSDRPGRDI